MHSFKVNPCLGTGFLKQCFRVYLKMSNEAPFGLVWRAEKLHMGIKHLESNSLGGVWSEAAVWTFSRQSDLQHDSCSRGVGVVFAGDRGSSVPRPSWHGLGQQLPPGLQLPVPPRRGHCCSQELLQRAGWIRPLVVIWMPAHAWGSGGALWLLVGRHQPCWYGMVGVPALQLHHHVKHCYWTVDVLTDRVKYFRVSLNFLWQRADFMWQGKTNIYTYSIAQAFVLAVI